jgi:gamma-glutamyltranspeptidase/glutathione hydrolase
VLAESGVSAETVAELEKLGHVVERTVSPHGGGQAIWIDWDRGVFIGGSDPRKDGCALGY